MKKIITVVLCLIVISIIFFLIDKKQVYFNLYGKDVINLNFNEEFRDDGFKATYCNKYLKFICKNINNEVKITRKVINNYSYNVIYKLDYMNSSKTLVRQVNISDTVSPEIKLFDKDGVICANKNYNEPGFKAYDNYDGDITDKVMSEIKENKIYYTVSDSSGNKRVVYRDIKPNDNVKPEIKLNGDTVYIFKDEIYNDKGYSATDNCDGDITNSVIVDSNVNTAKVGTYKIVYSVTDSNGNKTSSTRKVIVYDDISKVPKNGKNVYITFDDGPCSYTSDILKVLDKYNVKATFFVTNQFSDYAYMIGEEYKKGHSIGVHTFTHSFKKVYSSLDNYLSDFNNMNEIIKEQTGSYSTIFRFPGGSSNTVSRFNKGIVTDIAKYMTDNGYVYFDWNVDSEDVRTTSAKVVADNVIKEIEKHDNSVVLMHDIKKINIESIEDIISYGLSNGYTFLPIDNNTPIVHHRINN